MPYLVSLDYQSEEESFTTAFSFDGIVEVENDVHESIVIPHSVVVTYEESEEGLTRC